MQRTMRWCVLGLAGALLTGACESNSEPKLLHPLLGTWDLASMTLNGAPEDPADWNDVAVQIAFLGEGWGWTYMEDYGQPESGPIAFTWSTGGGILTMQLEGEDQASLGYTVSGITLTFSDTEGQESWTWVYTRIETAAPVDTPIVQPPKRTKGSD